MQHLPILAAHGDAVAGALERPHHPRCAEEGDGGMSKGDYEGNHKDLYPTNMPVIDDL